MSVVNGDDGEHAPNGEAEQVQTESRPQRRRLDKKLWITLVAIIVAAVLIGSAAYVLLLGGGLDAKLVPETIPDMPAGSTMALTVEVKSGSSVVTADDGVTYSWSVTPSSLGTFDRVARASVSFTANEIGGEGTIRCAVSYNGDSATAEGDVVVQPPFLDSVTVSPSTKTLSPDEEFVFTAIAIDSVGDIAAETTFSWSVSGLEAGDYTLNRTAGESVSFVASVEGTANLTVSASKEGLTKHGYSIISITSEVSVRTVDYYWYDLFAHPLGEWYEWREDIGGDEWAITDSYPYIYMNSGYPPGNTWIYTNMRMNVTGRNMTELNMNANPEFLPYMGEVRGGTAVLDWHMDYATYDYCAERLGAAPLAYYDGWYVYLNGTISLDRQASMAVLGITSDQYDDFESWWSENRGGIEEAWRAWLIYEAGNDRLAIFNAYEYYLDLYYLTIHAEKTDTGIQLSLDTVGWGLEALMFRWMNEAWMPVEYWMEDMDLIATIGPEMASVDIDTAVAYAAYAYEATEDGRPCWAWEGMRADYVESTPEYPISLFDAYADFTYENYAPGSEWYGFEMDWDYVPGAWNLSEGETLTLEWPADDNLIFFANDDEGIDGDLVPGTIDSRGPMTVAYAEPMPSDDPDLISIDPDARTISYLGPFDMWTWSKDQDAHEWLSEEWDRLGMLPYGAPYVEFQVDTGEPTPELMLSDVPASVEMGEEFSFNVTVRDAQTGDVMTDYTGTVTFTSSDGAADLPDDYEFLDGDMGRHEFVATLNTVDAISHQATHSLTATDASDASLTDSVSGILVVESPRLGSFGVVFGGATVIAFEEIGVTVTALNQWGETFTGYDGTVNFTSSDEDAILPANTTYSPEDNGVMTFTVTFGTEGVQTLTVVDVADPSASGEGYIDVQAPRVPHHYEVYGLDEDVGTNVTIVLNITIVDQYGAPFMAYGGTVLVTSNNSDDFVEPAPGEFVPGTPWVEVEVVFTRQALFTVNFTDDVDPTINATVEVQSWDDPPVIDHFFVTGITDMWENNASDVTVTAINQYDSILRSYAGTIVFSSNASSGASLPTTDLTFVPALDNGVKTFDNGVSFADPGWFNVTVADASDPTVWGSQENILIEDLAATTLEVVGPSSEVAENETFSLTVTVYHQYDGWVFTEYDGTVDFDSTDDSGYAVLPSSYEFQPSDEGTHVFTISLSMVGTQTVTVEDVANSLLESVEIVVVPLSTASITYRVYDMFEEPWHDWWDWRVASATWDTERLLTSEPGSVTYLYSMSANPNGNNDEGTIYAPYRWNVTATDIDYVDVSSPEFMPVFGSETAGAEASVHVRLNYIHPNPGGWWDVYWVPTWGDHPDWPGDDFADGTDGYWTAALYDVTMNRAAAEEWMGLPDGVSPAVWWASNEASYVSDWQDWIDYEGNERLDIYNAYEYTYLDFATMMRLTGDETTVHLTIGHICYGYEVLMTKWLHETGISPHQALFEDFNLTVDYSEDSSDVLMDTVCQWSLRAVKANASDLSTGAPGAWAWEATGIDYLPASISHPDSQFTPYYYLTYQSWNAGDPAYTTERSYEGTPWALVLPEYAQLIVEMSHGTDIIGYLGEPVDKTAVKSVWSGDTSDYDAIRYMGEMSLGTCILNGLPGDQMVYDSIGKTLTIQGPYTFDNPRGEGLLYHGAPWLEFNVTEVTALVSSAGSPDSPSGDSIDTAVSVPSVVTALLPIVAIAAALVAVVVAGCRGGYLSLERG